MADDDRARPAAAGRALLGALAGAAGAGAMGLAGRELLDAAGTSAGAESMVAWVLVGGAALGALLCLRLALVWTLAAGWLLAGPTGRTGTALLAALRLLAPRLARRLTAGAALATAATALTLGPALAVPASVLLDDDGLGGSPAHQSSRMLLEVDAPTPEDPAAQEDNTGQGDGSGQEDRPTQGDSTVQDDGSGAEQEPGQDEDQASPPPLGWGGTAPPSDEASEADRTDADRSASEPGSDSDSDSDTAPEPEPEPEPEPGTLPAATPPDTDRTVIVHTGDSLWSISRDLLGQGAATDPEIAAAWPLLHAANQDRIGADPDLLHPGLELVVPAELTPQDMP